jgi:hypothetical protein
LEANRIMTSANVALGDSNTVNRDARNVLSAALANPYLAILFMITVLGGIIRFYGLSNYEGTDEYNEVFEALRVASGHFNYERWWKKGYQNLLAIEYGVYFVQGYLRGLFENPMDFAAQIIRNMDPLFLIGRYTTATLGTASVALTYLVGRQMYSERAALLAAAMMSLSPLHVWVSHLVNTDVPLTFFFLCSLYFVCRFYHSGSLIHYGVAAALGAVTLNMKLTGLGIGMLFIGAHFARGLRERRSFWQILWCREILISTVSFIAGFVCSNPPVVFAFKKWVASFIWQYGIHQNAYDQVPYAIGDNGYYSYMWLLYGEMGAILFASTLIALVYCFVKRDDWSYMNVGSIAIIFLVLGSTTYLVQNRYFMTALPLLFILNGRLWDDLVNMASSSSRVQAMILCLVLSVAIFVPAKESFAFTHTLTETNTSRIAKEWIEANIPAGSKILIDAGHTIITSGPLLNQSREKLEAQLNTIRNLKEGETFDSPQVKIVDSYAAIYFELLLKTMPAVTYDITTTELGREIEPLQYYVDHGYQYFVHNADLEENLLNQKWRSKYPQSVLFYESLNSSLELIMTFEPSPIRSGQTVRIYKFRTPSP